MGEVLPFRYNFDMPSMLPKQVKKYFWGDNLALLSWPKHKRYILQTLLERGDLSSLHWVFKNASKEEVLQMLPGLRLREKSANFWRVYLS